MTYGSLTWADYRCGKCGTYLVKHQTHHGARGDRRCNKCGQQVRENPRVTTETIQKRRMTRHNAN
jgi:DNA-directed RNA polymerase subunit RPC12/RpoP